MAFELKNSTYEPHPEGTFKGTIIEVKDMGEQDTKFGSKHRIAIVIQNDELERQHWEFCNLASGKNSSLTTLRQKLFKRALTSEEMKSFDPEVEMVNKKIRFQIEHEYGDTRTFANLVTWSLLESVGSDPFADEGDQEEEDLPF